jgi:hypothetical protein
LLTKDPAVPTEGHRTVLHVVVRAITVFQLRVAWNVSVISVVPRLRFMNPVRNVFKTERDQQEWEVMAHITKQRV